MYGLSFKTVKNSYIPDVTEDAICYNYSVAIKRVCNGVDRGSCC